jgi:hypothetical protein
MKTPRHHLMARSCFPGNAMRVGIATRVLACSLLAVAIVGCDRGAGSAQAEADPKKIASALSGEDKVAADTSPVCKLFTPGELSKFVGLPLAPGRVAAMGSGCQWPASSGDGSALIQVVPADYHEPHSGAPGFKNLADIGRRGFVENDMGWNAGTIVGSQSVVVSVSGPGANEATAIALLKETLVRRSK